MREIVLDTETTGLDPAQGHRIVEIGAVELVGHRPTGRNFHVYINPERDMPSGAEAVHGLSAAFLADKPRFSEIVDDFLAFIAGDPLVIHNAPFDMAFLNAELGWCGRPVLPMERAIDTLEIARRRFPGAPNSLDALCRRFGIDNSARDKHGALLDAELLAEVYFQLVGGEQPDFGLALAAERGRGAARRQGPRLRSRPRPLPGRLSEAEARAHAEMVEALGERALWRELAPYGGDS